MNMMCMDVNMKYEYEHEHEYEYEYEYEHESGGEEKEEGRKTKHPGCTAIIVTDGRGVVSPCSDPRPPCY